MNFEETWVAFLGETKRVGLMQINKRNKHDDLALLLEQVIDILTHEDALAEVRGAVNKMNEEENRGSETVRLFDRELKYITLRRLQPCTENSSPEQGDAALDDAKTGKDSFESLFGKFYRKWLKDKLDILNEILKLIHGN